jgi:enamine deaminase RidA (YjgF/YER057c/UK114 family)
VWTGGVVGRDENEHFPDKDMAGQFRRILASTVAILAEAGAGPEHIVRMTWYVTDRREYLDSLPAIGAAYLEIIGRNFPAMAVVQVVALMEEAARIEIETTAVIPHS